MWLDPLTTRNPFLGTKLLGLGFGGFKGVNERVIPRACCWVRDNLHGQNDRTCTINIMWHNERVIPLCGLLGDLRSQTIDSRGLEREHKYITWQYE